MSRCASYTSANYTKVLQARQILCAQLWLGCLCSCSWSRTCFAQVNPARLLQSPMELGSKATLKEGSENTPLGTFTSEALSLLSPLKQHSEHGYDSDCRGSGLMLKCLNVLEKPPVPMLLHA